MGGDGKEGGEKGRRAVLEGARGEGGCYPQIGMDLLQQQQWSVCNATRGNSSTTSTTPTTLSSHTSYPESTLSPSCTSRTSHVRATQRERERETERERERYTHTHIARQDTAAVAPFSGGRGHMRERAKGGEEDERGGGNISGDTREMWRSMQERERERERMREKVHAGITEGARQTGEIREGGAAGAVGVDSGLFPPPPPSSSPAVLGVNSSQRTPHQSISRSNTDTPHVQPLVTPFHLCPGDLGYWQVCGCGCGVGVVWMWV